MGARQRKNRSKNGISEGHGLISPMLWSLFVFWKYPRLVIWFLLTLIGGLVLRLPFSMLQIIPGHLDFNPGIGLIPVAGVLFGPAGAMGAMTSSLLGDLLLRQFDALSFYRAIGILLFALGSERLWDFSFGGHTAPKRKRAVWTGTLKFTFIAWPGCFLAAAWRGLGSEVMRLYPFVYIMSMAVMSYLIFCVLLGAPLYHVMAKRWVPVFGTWKDIMPMETGTNSLLTASLLYAGGIAACALGMYASGAFYNVHAFHPFILGTTTGRLIPALVLPVLLLQVYAVFRR